MMHYFYPVSPAVSMRMPARSSSRKKQLSLTEFCSVHECGGFLFSIKVHIWVRKGYAVKQSGKEPQINQNHTDTTRKIRSLGPYISHPHWRYENIVSIFDKTRGYPPLCKHNKLLPDDMEHD